MLRFRNCVIHWYTEQALGWGMRILVDIEKRLRQLRDDLLIRRLIRSKPIRRHIMNEFDAVIAFLDDHCLAFDPRDQTIGKRVKQNGGWFREETMLVFESLRSIGRDPAGKVFFEVGANIGTQTVYAMRFGGFTHAICLEPDPRNARLLRINARMNGFGERVSIIPAAAGDKPGRLPLFLSTSNSGAHSLRVARKGQSICVQVVTVDDTLSELGVTADQVGLAWIDAEGYEPEVIAGASSLLAHRIPILIEFNPTVYQSGVGEQLLNGLAECYEHGAVAMVNNQIEWRCTSEIARLSFEKQIDLLFA